MIRGRPPVFSLPFGDRWIVFSPRTRVSALVNEEALKELGACLRGGREDEAGSEIRDLRDQLVREGEGLCVHDPDAVKLVILPTRACNMHCVYCDFDFVRGAGARLDPRSAFKLIDRQLTALKESGKQRLHIHFFGGEPMAAPRCLEAVIHYSRMACAGCGIEPWFEVTTNGLFRSSAIPLLGDYTDSVVVSIDGPEYLHDLNRRRSDGSGSYSAIAENIHALSRYPVELSLRSCITRRSVDHMAEITRHFCETFSFSTLSFEMLTPTGEEARAGLEVPDPFQFALGVLTAEKIASAHGVSVVHGPSELTGPRESSCPLGTGTLMLNPDGAVTACYLNAERWERRGLDLTVGRVQPDGGVDVDQDKLNRITRGLRTKTRCVRCFCRYTCAGGCHVDHTPPACPREYDDRCAAIRGVSFGRLLRNLDPCTYSAESENLLAHMRRLQDQPDDRFVERGGAEEGR